MRRLVLLLALVSLAFAQRRGVTAEDYLPLRRRTIRRSRLTASGLPTRSPPSIRRPTGACRGSGSPRWTAAHPPVPFTGESTSSTFAALVARRTIHGVSLGPRRRTRADLAAFAQWRRSAARYEPGERRVELRVVARLDALRLPDAHRPAAQQERATSATTRTSITNSTTPDGSTKSARTWWWSMSRPARPNRSPTAMTGTIPDPHWSPDSTRIAFVSNRTGHEFDLDRNSDVWVIPAAGGALTKISDHEGPDRSPRWSPDGKPHRVSGRRG